MSYRTHNCGELRLTDAGSRVKLAGWVKRVRDLGSMAFIALRDHYGVTQVIIPSDASEELQDKVKQLKPESIVMIEGVVRSRDKDINPDMPTGEIELLADNLIIDSIVEDLPFPLNDILPSEDLRLKYRFIDLRREKLQANLRLRSRVIYSLRKYLIEEQGFMEIQTPILTVSSPEGARDFVVPCRVHPGRFYALPQAPQQYKQLLMCSGFDKYFQIAPCFRDEDARADRSPGEFYQLDMEMAFPTQDRVFETIEKTFKHLNEELSDLGKRMMEYPFPRITFKDAMEKYGSDKPDIRFGMEMQEVSDIFVNSEFKAFASNATGPNCVKAIVAENTADRSRKFFDKAEAEVKKHGARGLAYLKYKDGEFTGSIRKFLSDAELDQLIETLNVKEGDSILLCAGERNLVRKAFGKVRVYLANVLELLDKDLLAFCWIVDFPMFEYDEEEEKIDFSHNPFSMPQGGMDALLNKDPLDILAYQYDIVCNGYELSSGAIRNHRPDIMYKAFEIVGYGKEVVDEQFGHMISAFKFGAPPHGGLAPGVDRIVMIYADEPNIREVTAFPMNQKAQDLMMGAPSEITQQQLDELHLQLVVPEKEKA